ncbi:CaiB/BaiF CoA transferase family protein [Afipia sp. DC4300-2b1]|uniref:CaiB/BaiF CoA transferase family protein n=1 Tax=Afipia sp. DC4300-2b1 TaxID=2804672 RepID=UPI003CF22C6B
MESPDPSAAKPKPIAALPARSLARGFNLLDGVKVVDLTTSVAGPSATMLLADMGAEVLKIERPGGGDDARAWGPPFLDGESLWFLSVNRNKKSIALDYSQPDGLDILHRLVRLADVVVVNLPPRVARKLKVDAESLQSIRSDLIYVSITGFGLKGARADWTCYDLIAEGYSGIMDITGDAGGEPQKIGAPAADMLAGQDAAFAAVSALFSRQRTGEGHVIDIALVDSMTRFLSCRIMPYLGSGEVPTRSGGKDSVIAIYQAFETADDPITLALGNDNLWQRFWRAVGQPEVIDEPGLRTNADRRQQRQNIVARIGRILREKPRAHWLTLFCSAGIPSGPINRVDQVVADEVLLDRGLFYKIVDGDRVVPQVGTGIHVDGMSNSPRAVPPRLGEHTHAVLQDMLGLNDAERARLSNHLITRGKAHDV